MKKKKVNLAKLRIKSGPNAGKLVSEVQAMKKQRPIPRPRKKKEKPVPLPRKKKEKPVPAPRPASSLKPKEEEGKEYEVLELERYGDVLFDFENKKVLNDNSKSIGNVISIKYGRGRKRKVGIIIGQNIWEGDKDDARFSYLGRRAMGVEDEVKVSGRAGTIPYQHYVKNRKGRMVLRK